LQSADGAAETDVMIYAFSPKMAIMTQSAAEFCKKWIITLLFFKKNANFVADHC
jgi:hypothetical protein